MVFAHMPWLSTDEQGHVVMWFGESPSDRTYHLPPPIAGIQLHVVGDEKVVSCSALDTKDLVGLRSDQKVPSESEVFGSVTYGSYHGTRLTYHVEHLPQVDPANWPSAAREDADYQTVVSALPDGGVSLVVLEHGKPLPKVDVKLFCEDGHEEASAKTDSAGLVTFTGSEVEPGLNSVMVSVSNPDAKGEVNGEAY
ncbi:MAG: hypothetical protein AAF989_07385, partial [Planctomycetota bacterium]